MAVRIRSAKEKAMQSDRLTLDRRLRLHKRMQPIIVWLQREYLLISLAPIGILALVHLVDRHSLTLWPLIGLAVWLYFTINAVALWLIWWKNMMQLASYDDIAVVAPLLDFADATFLRYRHRSGRTIEPSEAIVLPHLPGLLARMPAGDGPALTPSQKTTLRRLVCDRRYAEHFYAPGLREKADWIVYR